MDIDCAQQADVSFVHTTPLSTSPFIISHYKKLNLHWKKV